MSPFPLVPYVPILLSEVEQEQRPSGNGDREAIVVGAGLCDGEGERAYIGYAPHYIFALKKSVFADVDNCLAHFAEFRCPLCRKKILQNRQGRDTLPNLAKWVSENCPIFPTAIARRPPGSGTFCPKTVCRNVEQYLPKFFRQTFPLNLPNFVGTICRIPNVFK